jgi:hypothetical protein
VTITFQDGELRQGLLGIAGIDLVTFGGAIATLLLCHIPQPPPPADLETRFGKLTFGSRTFGDLIGTGTGAGMALLYVACALAMVGVSLGGYCMLNRNSKMG